MGGFCLLVNHKGSSSSARSPPRRGRAQVGLCCGSGHERLPYTSQVCMHTHPPAHSPSDTVEPQEKPVASWAGPWEPLNLRSTQTQLPQVALKPVRGLRDLTWQ